MAPATSAVIDIRNVTRVYHAGDVDVHALRGVEPGRGARRVRRHRRLVRVREIHADGDSRVSRSADERPVLLRRCRRGRPERAGTRAHAQRADRVRLPERSTCWRGRAPLENVALPLFYSQSGSSRRGQRLARARAALAVARPRRPRRRTRRPSCRADSSSASRSRARSSTRRVCCWPTSRPATSTRRRRTTSWRRLVALNREQGVTIIVVTHEPDIAAYADRVITMRDGEIVSDERKAGQPRRPSATGEAPRASVRRGIARSTSGRRRLGLRTHDSRRPRSRRSGATGCARR